MRSVDVSRIYAVGECAQHQGRCYGLVAPAWEQAAVVAYHITGRNPAAVYRGSKIATKLKVMGVELASMGAKDVEQEGDEVVQFSEPKRGIYKKLVIRDGVLVAAILLGDTSMAAYLMQVFDRATHLPDERDARFINDWVHANIQKDRTFSDIPRIFGGVTSADQLRRIADVADKYNVPMVKITGGQRIDLLGIQKEDLPKVWQDLDMPSGHAYAKSFRTCKTCVGTEFCRYGVGDSTGLGINIEQRFQGIESPGKLKLATAGCPRNCSEAMVKDIGAVAVEGGRRELYAGGAAGAHVRKGDVLCVVESHDDALTMIGRFMQYYRENAKYLERTYGFVERLGIEKIRAIVVEDSEGIAARLDADIQASVDAYVDPWLEARAPATANQFNSVLQEVTA